MAWSLLPSLGLLLANQSVQGWGTLLSQCLLMAQEPQTPAQVAPGQLALGPELCQTIAWHQRWTVLVEVVAES